MGACDGSKRVGQDPHITGGGTRPSSWQRTISKNWAESERPRITINASSSSGRLCAALYRGGALRLTFSANNGASRLKRYPRAFSRMPGGKDPGSQRSAKV